MRWGAALAISVLAIAAPGHAQNLETTLEMQSWCKPFATIKVGEGRTFTMPSDYESRVCWGAFASIQELSRIVNDDGKPMIGFCTRSSSTRIQLIQIFLRYAQEHPEQANSDFAWVAGKALSEAFPCR